MATEVGSAYISLLPSMQGFTKKVQRELNGTMDRAGKDAGQEFSRSMTRNINVGKIFGKAFSAVGNVSKTALAFGAVSTAAAGLAASAASALPAVAGLGAAIAATAPAAGVAVPALIGLAAGVAVAKLATVGLGDAFKAIAEGDGEKFTEALKKMAPAAQDFAKEVRKLYPQFRNLQRAVQNTFFAGIRGELTRVTKNLLPAVRRGLVGIAAVANDAARGVSQILTTRTSRNQVVTILESVRRSMSDLSDLPARLTRSMLQIGTASTRAFEDISAAAGSYVRDFTNMIARMSQAGTLRNVIEQAVVVAKQLGATFADVGRGIGNILKAASGAGATLGAFSQLAASFASITGSASGQQALTVFFQGIAAAGGAVNAALGELVRNVLPALGSSLAIVAPVAADLFRALGPALGQLVRAVGPVVAVIGGALADAIRALSPAIGPVTQAITALVNAVAPALPAIAGLAGVIATALAGGLQVAAAALAPFIKQVSAALVPVLPILADSFGALLASVLPLAAAIGQALGGAMARLAPVLLQVAVAFGEALQPAIPRLTEAFLALVPPLTKLVEQMGAGLGQALLGVIPLMPQLVESGVRMAEAFAQLATDLSPILPDLTDLAALVLSNRGGLIILIGSMTAATNTMRLLAGGLRLGVSAFNTARGAVSAFMGAIQRAVVAVAVFVSNAIGLIRGMPGRIVSALGNTGGMLLNSGRAIIQGLINGIKSMAGRVKDAVGSVLKGARNLLPFSPAKEGPFSGKGWTLYSGQSISEGLAEGIRSRAGAARAAALELAAAAHPVVAAGTVGARPSLALAGVGAVASRGGDTYHVTSNAADPYEVARQVAAENNWRKR